MFKHRLQPYLLRILIACVVILPANVHAISSELSTMLISYSKEFKEIPASFNQNNPCVQKAWYATQGAMASGTVTSWFKPWTWSPLDAYTSVDNQETVEWDAGAVDGCTVKMRVTWSQKHPKYSGGVILVSSNITCDPCGISGKLLSASIRFSIPVFKRTRSGKTTLSHGSPRKFYVEAECCGQRKKHYEYNASGLGKIVKPGQSTTTPVPPSRPPYPVSTGGSSSGYTAPPPRPAPKPKPRPKPKPKPAAEPDWSVDNPCPPCYKAKANVDFYINRIAALKAKATQIDQDIGDIQAEIDAKKTRIKALKKILKRSQGTGGSSRDTRTGETITATDAGNGYVEVVFRDRNGRITGGYTRKVRTTKETLAQIEKIEGEIDAKGKELKKKQAEKKAVDDAIKQAEADLAKARLALKRCIEKFCHGAGPANKPASALPGGGAVVPGGGTAVPGGGAVVPGGGATTAGGGGCVEADELETRDLGEIPSGVQNAVKSAASGVMGGLLGSVTGGMIGMGGGGEPKSDGVRLSSNPFGKTAQQTITGAGEFPIGLDSLFNLYKAPEPASKYIEYDDDGQVVDNTPPAPEPPGLTIGYRFPKSFAADDKLTFSGAYLFDGDCNKIKPAKYLFYEVWQESKFSLSVEFWRWRDGELVENWKTFDSGELTEQLASGKIPYMLGLKFNNLSPGDLLESDYGLMSQWTYQRDGRMFGFQQPFALRAEYSKEMVDTADADAEEYTLDFRNYMDYSGGMTKIDPPTIDLDAPEEETFEIKYVPYFGGGMTEIDPPTIDLDDGKQLAADKAAADSIDRSNALGAFEIQNINTATTAGAAAAAKKAVEMGADPVEAGQIAEVAVNRKLGGTLSVGDRLGVAAAGTAATGAGFEDAAAAVGKTFKTIDEQPGNQIPDTDGKYDAIVEALDSHIRPYQYDPEGGYEEFPREKLVGLVQIALGYTGVVGLDAKAITDRYFSGK